jgi:hypothetical protein
VLQFLLPVRIHRPQPGLDPRTFGTVVSTITTKPPMTTFNIRIYLFNYSLFNNAASSSHYVAHPMIKVKVKQSRYTPWRRLGGEEIQLLLILDLGTRWGEWSASRPDRALPPGKGPPVPIVQEAGWAPEPVWTQRLEKKSFCPAGDRTSIARSSSP